MRNVIFSASAILLIVCSCGCVPEDDSAKTELNTAYGTFDRGDYDAALSDAQAFLQHTPNGPGSAEAYYLAGRVFEQRAEAPSASPQVIQSNLDQARGAYTNGLVPASAPKVQALLHAGLANVAYHLDDYGTAVREWQISYTAIEPSDAKAWVLYRIGVCQQRLGWFAQADRSFQMVRVNFPGSEPAQRAAQHEGATGFYVQVGAYKDFQNANRTVSSLKAQGLMAEVVPTAGEQIVRVGPVPNFGEARAVQMRVAGSFPGAIVVP